MPKQSPGLYALNATQFLGAMNDNILKLLIVFFLIHLQGPEKAGIITASAGVAFVLPFLIFSAPAGGLADRYSKARVSVCMASSFAVLAVLISREGAKCDLFCNWLDLFGVVSFVVQIVVGGCCGVCALNVVVLCNLCTRFKATISSRGAAELAEKCNQS